MTTHELMPLYYKSLFPYESMYRWLSYGHSLPTSSTDPKKAAAAGEKAARHANVDRSYFPRREFCFTLEGDIFVRYQSFKDVHAMKSAIRERVPAKIDIGPVFSADPSRRAAYSGGAFVPLEREFVIDIDMTDYDDIRAGKTADAAALAESSDADWVYMTAAIAVLDAALRRDLGFEHLLWVYSGRRGVHCWVCDRRARLMTDEVRSAVAAYLQVYKGTEAGRARLGGNVSHPSVKRCVRNTLRPLWTSSVLPSQRLLERTEGIDSVLALVPDEDVANALRERWANKATDSVQRWDELEAAVSRAASAKRGLDAIKLRACPDAIVLAHLYPRLDVEVSKHMNHLLKAPFCVHPKTGRVCVPVFGNPEDFRPEDTPTVKGLLRELDGGGSGTSLDAYTRRFDTEFCSPLLRSEVGASSADAGPSTPEPASLAAGSSW